MTLEDALDYDILAALPSRELFWRTFLTKDEIVKKVAPLREREVEARLRLLVKKGVVELVRGGGGWPWRYGRARLNRRILANLG